MKFSKEKHIIEDGPLVKYAVPADTHHLFCKNCLEMYKKNMYLENHIIIVFDEDSMKSTVTNEYGKTSVMSSMMPLLKAWAAFIDYFTGVQTTFTIGKSRQKAKDGSKLMDNVMLDSEPRKAMRGVFQPSMATVEMHLANLNFSHKRITFQSSYAFMSTSRYVLFKTGLLLAMKPEEALTFMVHEFTSHRFDKNYEHLDGEEKDILEHRGHYGGKGHPFEPTPHCATDRKSKTDANAIGCMNGFIDKGYANFINALPFFKKWYDDHSSDPLTMFDLTSVKPSTTPPKKENVKKLPPAPPITPPTTITFKAPPGYAAATPKIPEPADLEEVVEV